MSEKIEFVLDGKTVYADKGQSGKLQMGEASRYRICATNPSQDIGLMETAGRAWWKLRAKGH